MVPGVSLKGGRLEASAFMDGILVSPLFKDYREYRRPKGYHSGFGDYLSAKEMEKGDSGLV